ncbi:MAG: glycosyltransferase family 2 protein [Planctomycetota bacterium]
MTTERPSISMVVPLLEEEAWVRRFLRSLVADPPEELILVDGGSRDRTRSVAQRALPSTWTREGFDPELPGGPARPECPHVRWIDALPGIASQLNCGAAEARGEILFFPYVDSRLPEGWSRWVRASLAEPGAVGGAFRLRLDANTWWSRMISSVANWRTGRGVGPLGDQALFMKRTAFESIGGYSGDRLLEDLDLVTRLRSEGRVDVCEAEVVTSARRWHRRGVLRTMLTNWAYLARHYASRRRPTSASSRRRYREYRTGHH